MRYLFTALWAVLISFAVSYVLTAMAGAPFVVQDAVIFGGVLFIFIVLMGDFVIKTKSEN